MQYLFHHLCLFLVLLVSTNNRLCAEGRLQAASSSSEDEVSLPKSNQTLCDRIHPENLPRECSCRQPGPFSLVVECLRTFSTNAIRLVRTDTEIDSESAPAVDGVLVEDEETIDNKPVRPDNNTIGIHIVLDPCHVDGSRLSLDITEANHDFEYTLSGIRAGEATNIPIPGLAVAVPSVGHVGLDVSVLMTGNMDSLILKTGLNACLALPTMQTLCASRIPGLHKLLPWYILSGTYSFGDVCARNANRIVEQSGAPLPATAGGAASNTEEEDLPVEAKIA